MNKEDILKHKDLRTSMQQFITKYQNYDPYLPSMDLTKVGEYSCLGVLNKDDLKMFIKPEVDNNSPPPYEGKDDELLDKDLDKALSLANTLLVQAKILTGKCAAAEEQKEHSENELKRVNSELKQAYSRYDQLNNTQQVSQEQFWDLELHIQELNSQINNLLSDNKNLERENAGLKKRLHLASDSIGNLKSREVKLSETLDKEMQRYNQDTAELRKTILKMHEDLNTLEYQNIHNSSQIPSTPKTYSYSSNENPVMLKGKDNISYEELDVLDELDDLSDNEPPSPVLDNVLNVFSVSAKKENGNFRLSKQSGAKSIATVRQNEGNEENDDKEIQNKQPVEDEEEQISLCRKLAINKLNQSNEDNTINNNKEEASKLSKKDKMRKRQTVAGVIDLKIKEPSQEQGEEQGQSQDGTNNQDNLPKVLINKNLRLRNKNKRYSTSYHMNLKKNSTSLPTKKEGNTEQALKRLSLMLTKDINSDEDGYLVLKMVKVKKGEAVNDKIKDIKVETNNVVKKEESINSLKVENDKTNNNEESMLSLNEALRASPPPQITISNTHTPDLVKNRKHEYKDSNISLNQSYSYSYSSTVIDPYSSLDRSSLNTDTNAHKLSTVKEMRSSISLNSPVPERSTARVSVESKHNQYFSDLSEAVQHVMEGEFLYKASKNILGQEKRKLSYFWINPQTKYLYWSPNNPGTQRTLYMSKHNGSQSAKSAFIKSIRLVPDPWGPEHSKKNNKTGISSMDYYPNPNFNSSHSKQFNFLNEESNELPILSIIIETNNKDIKLKACTETSHKIWERALSYLQSTIPTYLSNEPEPATPNSNFHSRQTSQQTDSIEYTLSKESSFNINKSNVGISGVQRGLYHPSYTKSRKGIFGSSSYW